MGLIRVRPRNKLPPEDEERAASSKMSNATTVGAAESLLPRNLVRSAPKPRGILLAGLMPIGGLITIPPRNLGKSPPFPWFAKLRSFLILRPLFGNRVALFRVYMGPHDSLKLPCGLP